MADGPEPVAAGHRSESEDDVNLEKGLPSAQVSEVKTKDIDPVRPWETGSKTRFPIAGAICMFIILLCCGGIFAILKSSDGQDFDVWGNWYYPNGLRIEKVEKWHRYAIVKGPVDFDMSVNVWISLFLFLCSKLLAFAFLEAITIYWWRQAMRGKTLRALQHDYEAGRSITSALRSFKMFNWLCVCTIAFTVFGAVGPILQKSSITQIKSTGWLKPGVGLPNGIDNMKTNLSTTFPPGASGWYNENGDFLKWSDLMWTAVDSYETSPQQLSRLLQPVTGCPPINSNRAVSKCTGYFQTIGWNYTCQPDTLIDVADLKKPTTFFDINFSYDTIKDPWNIQMDVTYKESDKCVGNKTIRHRRCALSPALVEVPILFDMFRPNYINGKDVNINKFEYMLTDVDAYQLVEQTKDFQDHYNIAFVYLSQIGPDSLGMQVNFTGVNRTLYIDNPVKSIRYPVAKTEDRNMAQIDDPMQTIGGFVSAFNGLVGSNYKMLSPSLNDDDTFTSTNGTFFLDYLRAISIGDQKACQQSFSDPTQGIINAIRELTFRYSIFTQYYNAFDLPEWGEDTWNPNNKSYVSAQPILAERWKWYNATRNVYHTSFFLVGMAMFIMLFGIGCTCSLYYGFWQLGRKVTLSPFEMSRALVLPDKPEAFGVRANEASNVPVNDLMRIVGDVKVKYGEVAPGILGMGLVDDVNTPKHGHQYR